MYGTIELIMQKLMAIFAHPDDEGAMGGTLAKYAASGVEVMLVCATRGEVGEISDPALATPETLGEVRQRELDCSQNIMTSKAWLRTQPAFVCRSPNPLEMMCAWFTVQRLKFNRIGSVSASLS